VLCQADTQVICRAVGQLSGIVRCLCQTSCQVLSVLSGACLTVEVLCSCRVLSELSGVLAVAVRDRLSDELSEDRELSAGCVRLLLLSDVGLLLSGTVRWCCRGAVRL